MNWSVINISFFPKGPFPPYPNRNKPGTSQCRVFTSRKGSTINGFTHEP